MAKLHRLQVPLDPDFWELLRVRAVEKGFNSSANLARFLLTNFCEGRVSVNFGKNGALETASQESQENQESLEPAKLSGPVSYYPSLKDRPYNAVYISKLFSELSVVQNDHGSCLFNRAHPCKTVKS